MHSINLVLLGNFDDRLDIKIAGHGQHVLGANLVGLIRLEAVREKAVLRRKDGDLRARSNASAER